MKSFLYALLALAVGLVLLFAQPSRAQQACDPSYPGLCIAPAPPDLDCADVSATSFRVLQPDPHRFDRDKDGIGCGSVSLHRLSFRTFSLPSYSQVLGTPAVVRVYLANAKNNEEAKTFA